MLKIPIKASVVISTVLNGALGALIAAACFFVPRAVTLLHTRNNTPALVALVVEIALFACAALGECAVAGLFVLLREVWVGRVFGARTVACLRAVSWCCVGAAVCFAVTCAATPLAFAGVFGALFMASILRVLKNVLEEAVALKSENDLTI
jgi:hypothetical protein